MNISATPNLNIGMRYETRVVLNFHTDVKRNDFSDEFGLVECYEKTEEISRACWVLALNTAFHPN
ncbi:MAG: hypothetical protein R2860_11310 [Desulfobacterales bacterium]